jgi:murein DD-endopeptidase MepM/ murein hydrolase activator NlpD
LIRKKYTVFIFPQGTKSVRKLTVPRLVPLMAGIVFMALVFLLLAGGYTYRDYASRTAEMERLRGKVVKQNVEIYALAEKAQRLQTQMALLTIQSKKLRARAQGGSEPIRPHQPALGGWDSVESADDIADPRTNPETFIRTLHANLDALIAQASYLEQSQQSLDTVFEDERSILVSTPGWLPCVGPITSGFGYRDHPLTGLKEFHSGLDISGPSGTPIAATADGLVVKISREAGYGLLVVVNHGYGLMTRYGHLSGSLVQPGQRVRRGQIIATMGSSGRTTGSHLHYEVFVNGVPVNPIRFLAHKD